MKLLQEYRGEIVAAWKSQVGLLEYTDPQCNYVDLEYLIGLTVWPLVFENGMLAANFVLSGATSADNIWRCIWLDGSLEAT